MREPRPFLEDGSQFGVSRTAFRRMPKAEKLELMKQWFFENFEDPANSTPYISAEGGYQWIWGGPYDAKEELFSKFEGLVPEAWIDEAVEDIESDGLTDWSPVHTGDDYDDGPAGLLSDAQTVGEWVHSLPDEPGPKYGTEKDQEVRRSAIDALRNLERLYPRGTRPGIGHNQPPDAVEAEPVTEADVAPIAGGLRAELEADAPSVALIKKLACALGDLVGATVKWTAHKLDVMIEEAAKSIGKKAGTALVITAASFDPHLRSAIGQALSSILTWLHVVTWPF